MIFEIMSRDWSEVYEWLSLNVPQATWCHTWCDYEHPETKVWTEIILFRLMNISEDDILIFRLCMSHVLRGNSSKDEQPAEVA